MKRIAILFATLSAFASAAHAGALGGYVTELQNPAGIAHLILVKGRLATSTVVYPTCARAEREAVRSATARFGRCFTDVTVRSVSRHRTGYGCVSAAEVVCSPTTQMHVDQARRQVAVANSGYYYPSYHSTNNLMYVHDFAVAAVAVCKGMGGCQQTGSWWSINGPVDPRVEAYDPTYGAWYW
jgi:hypothetical protein